MNTMVSLDEPIQSKNKGIKQTKKPKSDQDDAYPPEDALTYGINRLNLRDPENDSESSSKSESDSE